MYFMLATHFFINIGILELTVVDLVLSIPLCLNTQTFGDSREGSNPLFDSSFLVDTLKKKG